MKTLFLVLALIIALASCRKENIRPAKPKYMDTCRCRLDDVMSNRLPADSCGVIKITDPESLFGGTGLPSGILTGDDLMGGWF